MDEGKTMSEKEQLTYVKEVRQLHRRMAAGEWLSPREAAQVLGRTPSSVFTLMRRGELIVRLVGTTEIMTTEDFLRAVDPQGVRDRAARIRKVTSNLNPRLEVDPESLRLLLDAQEEQRAVDRRADIRRRAEAGEWISGPDAATLAGVTRKTAYNWARAGAVTYRTVGGGSRPRLQYEPTSLLQHIDRREQVVYHYTDAERSNHDSHPLDECA